MPVRAASHSVRSLPCWWDESGDESVLPPSHGVNASLHPTGGGVEGDGRCRWRLLDSGQ
jgi:hypothetical protein